MSLFLDISIHPGTAELVEYRVSETSFIEVYDRPVLVYSPGMVQLADVVVLGDPEESQNAGARIVLDRAIELRAIARKKITEYERSRERWREAWGGLPRLGELGGLPI
jgi:hypothetical protein